MSAADTAPSLPPLQGRVAWVFDDDFDIDQIIGVANLKVHDVEALAALAMNRFDPDFRQTVRVGDVLVGGRNFGYGHPHAGAMRAMRHLGIRAVIAESFFSSYWIGEIGYGFIQVVCPGIHAVARRGENIAIDFEDGVLTVGGTRQQLAIAPHSPREIAILRAGGLRNLLRNDNQNS